MSVAVQPNSALSDADLATYRAVGHVTIPNVFTHEEMDAMIRDIERWGEEFLAELPAERRAWYLDGGVTAKSVLRKLDNPHAFRAQTMKLATNPMLVAMVEALIGRGVTVYFSQVFFKPPEGGGPKPAHQDNFYFGPQNTEDITTAWIALDDATVENGCLFFGDGTNRGPIYQHTAPPREPFNLQLPPEVLAQQPMTPAPVKKGGVSFHHGNVFHQSGANRSTKWRRACALHFVQNETVFATPALPYDHALKRRVS
ncbi:MAG: phytanoyl-CoA dioxygenase family protein [Planctomycetota bacterium]